jgi:hypothetical protein
MKHRILLAGSLLLLMATRAVAQEKVFSGPQVGEKVTPFKVLQVVVPNAGKEKDFLTEFKGAPTVLVFIHALERSPLPLIRVIDQYTAEKKDAIRTLYIFLSEDRVGSEQRLPLVQQSIRLQSPLTLSVDGIEGPGNYGLNKKCLLTILVAKDNRVTANFALVQPGIADAPKVLAEIGKVIGDTMPPTAAELEARRGGPEGRRPQAAPERERPNDLSRFDLNTMDGLREAVKTLLSEVLALRREVAELRGQRGAQPPAPRNNAELPGAAPTDPKLISLLRSFIQPSNEDAAVDRVLKEVEDYIKDSPDLKKQAIGGWERVLHLKYGTEYAQKTGKTFLEKWKR